jgi:hypothetical protein
LGIGARRGRLAVYSYDGRRFRPADADEPVVTYRQDGDLLWAEIPAGSRATAATPPPASPTWKRSIPQRASDQPVRREPGLGGSVRDR